MRVCDFISSGDYFKRLEFWTKIGYVGKSENNYKYKVDKAAKHYISDTYSISKNSAKHSIIPKFYFDNIDPTVNCYYTIDSSVNLETLRFSLCEKLVEHNLGINNSAQDTFNYYF